LIIKILDSQNSLNASALVKVTSMNPTVTVVHLTGILDSAKANEMRQEIDRLIESGIRLILIDLEEVKFIDSSGLGGLAIALKAMQSVGGRLCNCCVGEQPRMLFELTGMEQVFEIFPNQEACYRAIVASSETCA
jgi:anti-anti-sigma factor